MSHNIRQDIEADMSMMFGKGSISDDKIDAIMDLIEAYYDEAYIAGAQATGNCTINHCTNKDHEKIRAKAYDNGITAGKLAKRELSIKQLKVLIPKMDRIMNTLNEIKDGQPNEPEGFFDDYATATKIYHRQTAMTRGDFMTMNDIWAKYYSYEHLTVR